MKKRRFATLFTVILMAFVLLHAMSIGAEEQQGTGTIDLAGYPQLELNSPAQTVYDGTEESGSYSFTPEEDGWYTFYSEFDSNDGENWAEPWATLFEVTEDGQNSLVYNRNGRERINFEINYELTAGVTYLLKTAGDSEGVEYTVTVEKPEVPISVTVELKEGAVPYVEGLDGYWTGEYVWNEETGSEDYITYFHYPTDEIQVKISVTAEYSDGTIRELNDWSSSYIMRDWKPGGENLYTVTYLDKSASISIPIISLAEYCASLRELELNSPALTVYDGTKESGIYTFTPEEDGWYTFYSEFDNNDGENHADPWARLDEITEEGPNNLLYDRYGSDGYNFRINYELTAGVTYLLRTGADFEGAEYTVTAEKPEVPISMTVELKEDIDPLVKGLDGNWSGEFDWNEETQSEEYIEYFDYDYEKVAAMISVTGEFSDGTTRELTGWNSSYNVRDWEPGGENLYTVTYFDKSASVLIPIISLAEYYAGYPELALDSPVFTVYDGEESGMYRFTPEEDGWYTFYSEFDNNDGEYWANPWAELCEVTENRLSGLTSNNYGREGNNFEINYELTAGVTYMLKTTGEFEGAEYTVTVEKPEVPVSVMVELKDDIDPLVKGLDGDWMPDSVWNEETESYEDISIFYYDQSKVVDMISVTGEYSDGSIRELTGWSSSYNRRDWEPGGENLYTVTYLDKSASVSIPIISFAEYCAHFSELELDSPASTVYDGTEESGTYSFTPEEDGWYTFYSEFDNNDGENWADPWAELCEITEYGLYGLTSNNYGREGNNFEINYELTAGVTYMLKTTGAFEGAEYTVTVEKTDVPVSVTVELKENVKPLVKGLDGYWTEDVVYDETGTEDLIRYFEYDLDKVADMISVFGEFSDGTTREFTGWNSSCIMRDWEPGGENLYTVTYFDKSASVSIPIISFAEYCESLPQLELNSPALTVYDRTEESGVYIFSPEEDGWYTFYSEFDDNDGENWADPRAELLEVTDNEKNNLSSNQYGREGNNFELSYELQAGVTYLLRTTGDFIGAEYLVNVEKPSVPASITVALKEDVAPLVEGLDTDGYWDSYWVGNDETGEDENISYFNYSNDRIWEIISVVGTYDDGITTELTGSSPGATLTYDCSVWSPGGENPVTVSIFGATATVSVPVISIQNYYAGLPVLELDQPLLYEQAGEDSSSYIFTPEEDGYYTFRWEFAEGYSDMDEAYLVLYEGLEDRLNHLQGTSDELSLELSAGTNYILKVSGGDGYKYLVSVEKNEVPTSVTVSLKDDMGYLVEGLDGVWDTEEDWEEDGNYSSLTYFRYNLDMLWNSITVTAEFRDGSVAELNRNYSGVMCDYQMQNWSPGGENLFTVSLYGVSGSVSIPVMSLQDFNASLPELTLDTPALTEYRGTSASGTYKFTPEEDGYYHFYAEHEGDRVLNPEVWLYEETIEDYLNYVCYGRDEYGNFSLKQQLTAGKTYYLRTTDRGEWPVEYSVIVTKAPDIEVSPTEITMREGARDYIWVTIRNNDSITSWETKDPEIADFGEYYDTYENETTRQIKGVSPGTTEIVINFANHDPVSVNVTVRDRHKCGDDLMWSFENDVLTISGTGDMWNESIYESLEESERNALRKVVVEPGVTSIGEYAFSGLHNMEEVELPASITRVGQSAFRSCYKLNKITLPENLQFLGNYVFVECISLKEIHFAGNAPEFELYDGQEESTCFYGIQAIAFYNAEKEGWTEDVRRPYGAKVLIWVNEGEDAPFDETYKCGDNAYWSLENDILTITGTGAMWYFGSNSMTPWYNYRSSVKEIRILPGITNVADGSFMGFESLEIVSLANTVSSIGSAAFNGCSNLREIVMPEDLSFIDYGAFSYCESLESIYFTGDAPEFAYWCFDSDTFTAYYPAENDTWTEEVRQDYGGTITWVAYDPDQPVFGEPDFVLPAEIAEIEESAFEGAAMSIVYIPDTCTRIGSYAFKDCLSLTQVWIPEGCSVDADAFSGCGRVYIFGKAGSAAESYCEEYDNLTFIAE